MKLELFCIAFVFASVGWLSSCDDGDGGSGSPDADTDTDTDRKSTRLNSSHYS